MKQQLWGLELAAPAAAGDIVAAGAPPRLFVVSMDALVLAWLTGAGWPLCAASKVLFCFCTIKV